MPRLSELADVLIECRVISKTQWQQVARTGGGDLDRILAALADDPPGWWDGKPPVPPGLTEYQRNAIQARFAAGELDGLPRDLALNHFLLLDKLGQGGQGEVYRGRQLNPPRFAAIKTLIRDTETRRRRFEQEARTMIKIRHPAVARFYLYERVRDAAGEPTDEYLIAMELVTGTELHRLIRVDGPVPWPFAVRWVVELLGGLAVIHRNGFIHRDMKPENVMVVGPPPGPDISPDMTAAKLLDFGAVTRAGGGPEEDATGAKIFLGTMEYAPPEQWTGEVVAASDLYALGGTLFFMLTGRTPYQKARRDPVAYRNSHTQDDLPDLREHDPDVPTAVNQLFQRMMSKDPADRGTAAELIDEFQQLQPRGTGVAAAPPSPEPPRSRPVPAAKPPTQVKSPKRDELKNPFYRAMDPILALFERVFIPGHLRPPPGEEPVLHERLAALLRRPLVLLILAAGLLLLILWAW
ncbi:MAG: stkP 6 [Gemmataceae bacterium]|nr:stkP 6 [Gemmataceae bacterium]